ncbi:MAG: DUF4442 domain-containing protein [Pseudomonadota bacterium]
MGFIHRLTNDRRFMKLLLNCYPPYIGAGIRVSRISQDFRELDVSMGLHFYNRNYVATHFGGSLYAMTDPFFMLMVMKNLGPGYIVWDKSAKITFKKPGKGRVTARFRLLQAQLDEAAALTINGARYCPVFSVDVVDQAGEVVALVEKELYIRRKSVDTN